LNHVNWHNSTRFVNIHLPEHMILAYTSNMDSDVEYSHSIWSMVLLSA
jgi:hypothetical protein